MIRTWRFPSTSRVCAAAAAVLLAATGACDPNAKASDGDRKAPRDRLSKEWESCASSLDCGDGLRCFENTCRTTTASVMGDYLAAVGARALAQGNVDEAIRAYSEAATQYQADAPEVPAWVYCELGHALAAGSRVPDNAERAARALHKCIREVPSGSATHARAMADLAVLGEVGLDPVRLKLTGDAEKYITKGPKRPASDAIKLTATGDAKRGGASYDKFLKLIESAEVRDQLLPCWEESYKATQKAAMRVTVPFKYYFQQGEYEEDDRYVVKVDGAAPAGDAARACVQGVLEPLATEFAKRGGGPAWTANITIAME